MRKVRKNSIVWSVLGVFLLCGTALSGQVLTMTFTQVENSPHHKASADFARLVKEKTNGAYEVQAYANSSLAGGNQLGAIEMIQNGAISCGWTSCLAQSGINPDLSAICIPWLWKDEAAIDQHLRVGSDVHNELNRIVRRKGYEIIGYAENGFRELTNNVRAVRKPEDMKGIKFRVVGSHLLLEVFSALGANPVDLNFTELFTSLQQGTVDGQENPVSTTIFASRFYEVQKYLTMWHYSYEPNPLFFNKRLWDSFTPEIRKAIGEAAEEASNLQKKYAREELDEHLRIIATKTEITYLTPEEIEVFKKAVRPVVEKHVKNFDQALIKALYKANE